MSTPSFADQAADPADSCTAAIQRAAGTHAKCVLHADADLALSDDLAAHQDRIDRCEDVFERRHQRALDRFGADKCPEDSADEFSDHVFEATGSVTLAAANTVGGGAFARLGPMKEAVRGMNYEPAPSNYTCCPPQSIYFDTDFYNQDFVQLWGTGTPPAQSGGRDDDGDLRSLGVNFIRVFNWNPQRNHEPWLQDLAGKGIYTAGVLSNFFVDHPDQAHLVVDQLNRSAAKARIAAWLVGNEISPNAAGQVLAVIKDRAQPPLDAIPICTPFQMSSTQDAIDKVRTNYQQQFVPRGLASRFIACLNFYGLGKAATAQSPADQLEEFVEGFLGDPFIKDNNIPLLFTEFGINFDRSSGVEPNAGGDAALQGQYLEQMLARSKALQARHPELLGQVAFEYSNERWKTPNTEANFGLYSLTPQNPPTGKTTSGASYPVDILVPRPQHRAVAKHY